MAPPPALLEVPRHGFLLGDWVWKENLLRVLIGPAEKWGLKWEDNPHAIPRAKTSPPSPIEERQKGEKGVKPSKPHAVGTAPEVSFPDMLRGPGLRVPGLRLRSQAPQDGEVPSWDWGGRCGIRRSGPD